MNKETRIKPEDLFLHEGYNCAESVLKGVLDEQNIEYNDNILSVAHCFGSGISGSGCVCGALSGGVMAIGYINAITNKELNTRGIVKTLHSRFVERNKCTCCRILSQRYPKNSDNVRLQCAGFVAGVVSDVVDLLGER